MEGCSEDLKDMVLLLLTYFDEKEENLFHYVEETCLANEVNVESLPPIPYHVWINAEHHMCTCAFCSCFSLKLFYQLKMRMFACPGPLPALVATGNELTGQTTPMAEKMHLDEEEPQHFLFISSFRQITVQSG